MKSAPFNESSLLQSLFSLKGRVALITGAGSGLGKYMSHALLQAGANVVLVGRHEDRLQACAQKLFEQVDSPSDSGPIPRFGTRIACVPFDVSELEALPGLAESAAKPFGSPDILVNAAGLNPRLPCDELTPEIWEYVLRLNLSAPFFLAQALMPAMRKKGWGRVINIASLQSSRAFTNGAPYGASKGGVAQLTRAMAEAWSKPGTAITANAIAPGFFKTELTAPLFAQSETIQALEKQTMFGRVGNAEDIFGLTMFLASPASDYVTGQVIYLDGGWSAK